MADIWQTFARGRRAVRGVAWAPAWTVPTLADDFGARLYFHSLTYQARYWSDGAAVPVLRSAEGNHRHSWVRRLAQLVEGGYRGPVIFGNEPDRPDQDNATPESMAAQYKAAAAWLTAALPSHGIAGRTPPQVSLVVGNAIDPAWTVAFMRAVGVLRPVDALGIHIYEAARLPGEPGWTWPRQRIGALIADIRRGPALLQGRLWVTEYGIEHAWPADVARRYVDEIEQSPHVSHAFAYTSHAGDYSEHARRFGFYAEKGSRELTPAGTILQESSN